MIPTIVKSITGIAPLMYSGPSKNAYLILLSPSYYPAPMEFHNNMEIPRPIANKIGVGTTTLTIQYLTLAIHIILLRTLLSILSNTSSLKVKK